MTKVVKTIILNFTPDYVRLLADNIVTILETMKSLTQPEMMKTINNAATVFKNLNTDDIEEYSIWKLMREINSPEIKRGFGFLISFLKNVSDSTAVQNNLISE